MLSARISKTPPKRLPMPTGHVNGTAGILSTCSISSISSSGSRTSRSSLLMNVMIGVVARAAHFQQPQRLRLHAVGRVDHHERRVDRRQHAVGVFREILVAGRVQEVDHAAAVLHLHDRARDRDPALLLDLHPVGSRVPRGLARFDAARDVDRAREEQELFGERGLARVRMRNDRKGAPARGFVSDAHVRCVSLDNGQNRPHRALI